MESLLLRLSSLIIILLSLLVSIVNSANILAIFPGVWKSHYIFGRNLIKHLVSHNVNHTVTIVSPYGNEENDHGQIREIKINGLIENWIEMGMSFDIEQMRAKSNMERFTSMMYAGISNIDLLLSDKNVDLLLKDNKKFDLVIADLFLSEALLGFSFYYDVPTVVISPMGSNSWLNHLTGNPHSYALDPSSFLPFTENMDIWERCVNTLMGIFEKLTYNFFLMISQQAIYAKHFRYLSELSNINLPHYRKLTNNLSLFLLNTNAIVQYPRAHLPNMLTLAGLHLKDKSELSLPQHLLSFIESGNQGTIYISFGANVGMGSLPNDKLNVFLDVFETLNSTNFLLKLDENLSEKLKFPSNVIATEWFPQQAILAHPNVKLFISSCGLMSVVESINFAKPILAIPIETEQKVTSKRLEKQGVSLSLEYEEIAFHSLLLAINKMTNNSIYAERMKKLSNLFVYDVPDPVGKALHYIELVLETGGACFLKSHTNDFNFLRSELLDVSMIIIFGFILIIAIPFLITCCILRKSYDQTAKKTKLVIRSDNMVKQFGRSNSYACSDETNTELCPTSSTVPPKRAMSSLELKNRTQEKLIKRDYLIQS